MSLGWFSELSRTERKTYYACFGGLALDSMDATMYALVLPTLIGLAMITRPEAGLMASANLIGAGIGGWLAGIAADRIGRIRVLQLTILMVAVSTAGAAFAETPTHLLLSRVLQGLGYGGEAAVGAVLISEVIAPRLRGRVAASIQSGYAVGNAISVALMPVIFTWLPEAIAWRAFFAIGFLPALFVFFIRRFVPESAIFAEDAKRSRSRGEQTVFWEIFTGPYFRRTAAATLFAFGLMGAAYVMITWLPTYLRTALNLPVTSTAGYLIVGLLGSFAGPLIFGQLADRLGRRKSFMLFLFCQAANVLVYTQFSITPTVTIVQGFFLGAFQAGLASGLAPTFSELFPTRIRANGAGFAVSAGRGFGAIVPGSVGVLSATLPLGDAMAICALSAYAIALLAATMLPETGGADLSAADEAAVLSSAQTQAEAYP